MRTMVGVEELRSKLNLLIGKPVWAVRHGAGSCLLVDLGDKVPRPMISRARGSHEGDREYQGELTLMILCAWRIELEGAGIVSGSGDLEDETLLSGPMKLIEQTATEVSVNSFLDLVVVFSNGLRLVLFCDQRTDDLDAERCYTLFVRREGSWSVGNNVITHEEAH
jgi:hypothetical protein